ncbi:50S ribosomal protein L5 [Ureaplasma zalophigenitalium]|uniref:Large ribosomal subunit protein uL5 n=2 Tax=Ureaplasma zalophigenitalium TaxID=907723 RepID=A0ABT3BNR5_9BACT|nr:50S ribosomal protein L5 [Ureaplasma zalophigenitalium]MCV3753885.1 50S ribosomal protein L5 [Ureaplasma zalophigenitalium]
MMSFLKELYTKTVVPNLQKEFAYSSVMQIPKVEKIIINAGIGNAVADAKNLEAAANELLLITGQKPVLTKAKNSIATFKLRKGQAIGAKVTLRGVKMWAFMEVLFNIALPRVRDFKGISNKSFDGHGNYTLGIKEQIIFPQVVYDDVKSVRGFDVTFVTTANTDEEARALLLGLGAPFQKQKGVK